MRGGNRGYHGKVMETTIAFSEQEVPAFRAGYRQMNMAWNDLHEDLGLLFQRIFLQAPMQVGMPGRVRTAWGLISSDRQKRVLLEGLGKRGGRFPSSIEYSRRNVNRASRRVVGWLVRQEEVLNSA